MLKRERAYAKIPRFGLKNVGNDARSGRKPAETPGNCRVLFR